jgi:hypothetical protein
MADEEPNVTSVLQIARPSTSILLMTRNPSKPFCFAIETTRREGERGSVCLIARFGLVGRLDCLRDTGWIEVERGGVDTSSWLRETHTSLEELRLRR